MSAAIQLRLAGVRAAATACAIAALCISCAPVRPPASAPAPPASRPTPATPAGKPTTPVPPAPSGPLVLKGEPTIGIGLSTELDSLEFSTLQPVQMGDGRIQLPERAGSFVVRARGGYLRVASAANRGDAPVLEMAASDTLRVGVQKPREGAIQWGGKSWRGEFRVFVNGRGRLTLVSRLPLESYLAGVVPLEIGALSELQIEAGKAQAIAARSYTLFYFGRRADEGFDLYSTVEDQVYGPIESERPLATRCVNETRGQVALSKGRPIRANYSATCGGISSDVWECWPVDPIEYLVSERDGDGVTDYCATSPSYRWREEWSAAEFVSNIGKYGAQQGVVLPAGGVGELIDVRVAERSHSGRVWRLEVVTSTGTVTIPSYTLRMVLRRGGNSVAILRSTLFKIEVRRDPATRRALAVVASGGGNGHGAGLCQVGALGMAKAGKKSSEIVGHYYHGVELKGMY